MALLCQRCGAALPRRYASCRKFCSRKCAAACSAEKTRKPRATCKLCGKPAPISTQRSCSAKCAYILRKLRTRKPRICPICKSEYFSKGKIGLKYCSIRCYNAVRGERLALIDVSCAKCGRIVKRTKGAVKRVRVSFCGNECRNAFFVGEQAAMWRGGSDPNRGHKWLKIAAAIRNRDGHICQRCGRTEAENGRRLDVDHIKPWRSFESEREANDPSNLVSLCGRCHKSKTSGAERAWLRGDCLAMAQYEKSVRLPPVFGGA